MSLYTHGKFVRMIYSTHFGGDQLTEERAENVQKALLDGGKKFGTSKWAMNVKCKTEITVKF